MFSLSSAVLDQYTVNRFAFFRLAVYLYFKNNGTFVCDPQNYTQARPHKCSTDDKLMRFPYVLGGKRIFFVSWHMFTFLKRKRCGSELAKMQAETQNTDKKEGAEMEGKTSDLQERARVINDQVQRSAVLQERAMYEKRLTELENRVFALEKHVHKPKRQPKKTDDNK